MTAQKKTGPDVGPGEPQVPAEPADRKVVVLGADRVQVGAGVWPLGHAIRLGLVAPDFPAGAAGDAEA